MAAAVATAYLRGDTGHAALAIAMAAWLLLLLVRQKWLLLIAPLAVCAALLALWESGTPLPVSRLEARLALWRDGFAYGVGPSDLLRVREIAGSHLPAGWGHGQVPWLGLGAAPAHASVPLQMMSDYASAASTATWGVSGVLMALAGCAIFLCLGVSALQKAGSPHVSREQAFTSALAGWLCLAVATRSAVSWAGTAGVLPLTGVPLVPLSYAPISTAAALMYAVAAYAAISQADEGARS